ncbi:MAG: hypothetical protein ACRD1C_04500 [Terriglobales bacterium]
MRVHAGARVKVGVSAAALLLLAVALAAQAPQAPRVTYARSFEGSVPAFFQIEVSRDGRAAYQAREKNGDPLTLLNFTASPAAVQEIFSTAAALHDFSTPQLQSKRNVAYTGDKMLAFDGAGHHTSQQFTFTANKAAGKLVSLFEAISVTGMDAIQLRRALQFQPLDVLQIMNQIQDDWSSQQMAEPQLLAPVLAAAASNSGVMTAAQVRAEKLLQEFAKNH